MDKNYHSVQITNSSTSSHQVGSPGQFLFRRDRSLRWYLLVITVYAVIAIGFAGYVATCPTQALAVKALAAWNWKVDQFYSGVVLSILLTPVGILIRKVALELALLHPFGISSRTATDIKHLDDFMDPGFLTMLPLFRYCKVTALVQSFLLLTGALTVPIGTLLITTGTYESQVAGTAWVGMPTVGNEESMTFAEFSPKDFDSFLATSMTTFMGHIVDEAGVITQLPSELGPTSNTNLTYYEGVRYTGILTFDWTSGCEYTNEISYTVTEDSGSWIYNVDLPGTNPLPDINAANGNIMTFIDNITETQLRLWSAIVGVDNQTVNLGEAEADQAITEVPGGGAWISRVVCTPTIDYKISSCLWRNGSMTDCYATPGANTTALDDHGLAQLWWYMAQIPNRAQTSNLSEYNFPVLELALQYDTQKSDLGLYRAPLLDDYNKMFGLVAQSIVDVATSGYFGVADVPTIGSVPRQVYLVRVYILAIVVGILVLVPLLTEAFLLRCRLKQVPLRRATLLTVANAVRGPWWDAYLRGGCVLSHLELNKRHAGAKFMFGVDALMPGHVGLAHQVYPVEMGEIYAGVDKAKAD